jgi:hypothetical protein
MEWPLAKLTLFDANRGNTSVQIRWPRVNISDILTPIRGQLIVNRGIILPVMMLRLVPRLNFTGISEQSVVRPQIIAMFTTKG